MTTPTLEYPKTVLVIHPKENRMKCSLEPLRGRSDLCFVDFSPKQPIELLGYVRLSVDGSPLRDTDAKSGILLIDGSWRHAARMHEHFVQVPPRSLFGYHTAYPRVSKLFHDPSEGLASIEALYIAYCVLGRPTDGLLDGYFWREQFLKLNGWT